MEIIPNSKKYGVLWSDNYEKILAYVYLEDGRTFNPILVWQGYTRVAAFLTDVKYQELLKNCERKCRKLEKVSEKAMRLSFRLI